MAVLKNTSGRSFLSDRTGCGQNFKYQGCLQIDGLDKSFGEETPTFKLSDTKRNGYTVDTVNTAAPGVWTTTITNTLRQGQQSLLEQLTQKDCYFNLQIHYGACNLPTAYTGWSEIYMLEDVRLVNYTTTQMTTASPESTGLVQETASITAHRVIKLYNPTITQMDGGIGLTRRYGNLIYCQRGECCNDAGCSSMYQIGESASSIGSVRIIYSHNSGVTWNFLTLDNVVTSVNSDNYYKTVCVGNLLYFIVNPTASSTTIYYVDTNTLEPSLGPLHRTGIIKTFNEFYDDFDIYEDVLYLVQEDRLAVYNMTTGNFNKYITSSGTSKYRIFVYNHDISIIGSDSGIDKTVTHGLRINVNTFPSGFVGDVRDAHIYDKNNIIIAGTRAIYCTSDGGITWVPTLTFDDEKINVLIDTFGSLVYLNTGTELYRSTNGGGSWELIFQEDLIESIGATGMQICPDNPNQFIFGMEENIYRGTI